MRYLFPTYIIFQNRFAGNYDESLFDLFDHYSIDKALPKLGYDRLYNYCKNRVCGKCECISKEERCIIFTILFQYKGA